MPVTSKSIKIGLMIFVVSFFVIAFIAKNVIQHFPNSADEYAYVFQAKNFAQGKVYSDIHPKSVANEHLQPYFYLVHIGENEGRYYGRFPPGYSLLLAPAALIEEHFAIKLYWTVNALFGAATVLLLFYFCRRYFSSKVGWIAVLLTLLNPWFLLTSGSFFSHTVNAFFIGLALFLFFNSVQQKGSKQGNKLLFYSGLAFGFALITRYLDPLPFLLPLLVYYLYQLNQQQRFNLQTLVREIALFCAGAFCFLLPLLAYNQHLTGDVLTTAYQFYNPHDSGTRFIFQVHTEHGDSFDFSKIWEVGYLQRTVPNVALLFNWFVWAWALLLLPLCLFKGKDAKVNRHRSLIIALLASIPAVIIIYLLYGGPPANQYGPRYFYAFYVPIALLSALSLSLLHAKNRYAKGLFYAFTLIFSTLSLKQLVQASDYFQEQIFERTNLFRTIDDAQLDNAVVFLTSHSGTMHPVDLTRNALDFSNEVLIAQSLNGNYQALMKHYPDRAFYEYFYRPNREFGVLQRIYLDEQDQVITGLLNINLQAYRMKQTGLLTTYFDGLDFKKTILKRIESGINVDWGYQSPDGITQSDNFSVQWQGLIHLAENGEYEFVLESDDGARLYIDDRILIDNWGFHGVERKHNKRHFKAGYHRIEVDYMEAMGGATIRLFYKTPQGKLQNIPSTSLHPKKLKDEE
ncbi:PA14 domain-containing protein [Psychromonas sp. psych-6C06]|uniref:PA14 domain-containing protein n=1 Tax=Psychromonas sp. psych-6C06 TaxID=2058089 RepID=UPI00187C4A54|nr:PA14 domain-containing protein [Psychromonas sp. psych-6C06]